MANSSITAEQPKPKPQTTRPVTPTLDSDLEDRQEIPSIDLSNGQHLLNEHECGPERRCEVLKLFQMVYLDKLGVILCVACRGGTLIHLSSWVSHFHNRTHPFTASLNKKTLLDQLHDHLETNMPRLSLPLSLPDFLEEPISLPSMQNRKWVASLLFCYPCPHIAATGEVTCKQFIAATGLESKGSPESSLQHHMSHIHNQSAGTYDSKGGWYQKLWTWPDSGFRHVFKLPTDYNPPVDPNYPPTPGFAPAFLRFAPADATWMATTGLQSFVSNLGTFDFEVVKSLGAIPSSKLVSAEAVGGSRHIEMGLLALQKETRPYLKGASDFVDSRHHSVRSEMSRE